MGHLATARDILIVTAGGQGATGIWWVEARVLLHVHQGSPTAKTYPDKMSVVRPAVGKLANNDHRKEEFSNLGPQA